MLSPQYISSQTRQNSGCLLAGIVIATLTEAIAGTALTLGKVNIIGDVYATPDEFAWLDIGYTTLKMIAFLTASWIATTVNLRTIIVAATVTITFACAVTALTTRLDLLIGLRAFQGFSGGLLLVIGQTVIFRDFRLLANLFYKPCLQQGLWLHRRPSYRHCKDGYWTAIPGRGFFSQ